MGALIQQCSFLFKCLHTIHVSAILGQKLKADYVFRGVTMEQIRNARPGDAYVQTESWKAAFREIVPADILAECTALESTAAMYRRIFG